MTATLAFRQNCSLQASSSACSIRLRLPSVRSSSSSRHNCLRSSGAPRASRLEAACYNSISGNPSCSSRTATWTRALRTRGRSVHSLFLSLRCANYCSLGYTAIHVLCWGASSRFTLFTCLGRAGGYYNSRHPCGASLLISKGIPSVHDRYFVIPASVLLDTTAQGRPLLDAGLLCPRLPLLLSHLFAWPVYSHPRFLTLLLKHIVR